MSIFQLKMVFQTQVPISLVIHVIGIQDFYISKYQYTINSVRTSFDFPCVRYDDVIAVGVHMHEVNWRKRHPQFSRTIPGDLILGIYYICGNPGLKLNTV